MDVNQLVQTLAIYSIPVLFAITLHEAAHGYVARHFGDLTAYAQGRISLNPFRHIDLVGTIVFVALGLAQNPRLRVMLVREGSVLDEDNLAELARIADENGAQVWLERVGNSGAVSVLIEDGAVKPRLEAVAGGAR